MGSQPKSPSETLISFSDQIPFSTSDNNPSEFNDLNLLILWKNELDLTKIVTLRMNPANSNLTFEDITQALAIQILLKKYPEITWSPAERSIYLSALNSILKTFDKELDEEQVPKNLGSVKDIIKKVP